ncbi:unnamed protein product [Lupinus luteus]|uniref:C2H2-type domain-containing protein n=1 Tax=Lupinus luteus TaxID=3873 RepID=A0AAV1WKU6_LUPLU
MVWDAKCNQCGAMFFNEHSLAIHKGSYCHMVYNQPGNTMHYRFPTEPRRTNANPGHSPPRQNAPPPSNAPPLQNAQPPNNARR